MERTIEMYGGKVYGVEVSAYGLKQGYLDYQTLAKIVGDCILNNNLRDIEEFGEWHLESGRDNDGDDYVDIYQDYIITESGANFLINNADEIVYYIEILDMYIWSITHFGTSWDYVLTDIKLKEVR